MAEELTDAEIQRRMAAAFSGVDWSGLGQGAVQRARQTVNGGMSPEEAQRLENAAVQPTQNYSGASSNPIMDQVRLQYLENEMKQGNTLSPQYQGAYDLLNKTPSVRQGLDQYYTSQDPTYGMSPDQLAAYAKNQGLEDRFGGYYSFFDPAFQMTPALLGQSAGSQAGASQAAQQAQYGGLTAAQNMANQNLEFMSPAQQQALMGQWAQVQGGQGAPDFAQAGARQGEQYGNLQGIIAGGGADAIELARRLKARQDSEAWLRGQREADMADYAERGLTGSGMELQNLAMDRQAAAGRNSLADAEMAAELEKRKMDAINSAAGLAGQMRGAEYQEKGYLDQRALNALNEQTDLASLMRNQQAAESVANRNAQQSSLNTYADLASKIRSSEAQESQYRATSADDFSKWNANTLNAVADSYTTYLRDQNAQAQKLQQDMWAEKLRTGVNVAQTMEEMKQKENMYGFGQGTALGASDAATYNKALNAYNQAMTAGMTGVNAGNLAGQLGVNSAFGAIPGAAGQAGDQIIQWISSGYGGGIPAMGGATGTGSTGSTSSPSTTTTTGQGQSNASLAGPFNYDPNKLGTEGWWK